MMSKVSFTPGPWQMGHSHSVENSDREKVASCINVNLGGGKCFANARLISSAPDLYAALEAMLEGYSGDDVRLLATGLGGITQEIHDKCDRMNEARNRARAALRKARGEEGSDA